MIMLCMQNDTVISLSPILMTSIAFAWLIALDRGPGLLLNGNHYNGHLF